MRAVAVLGDHFQALNRLGVANNVSQRFRSVVCSFSSQLHASKHTQRDVHSTLDAYELQSGAESS